MANNYEPLARQILDSIGGESNIAGVTHCATRLRFNLKDSKVPNDDEVKKIQGVMGVVRGGGQFQVIIGNDVNHVYKSLHEIANIESSNEVTNGEKKSVVNTLIDTLTGIFTPILPAITAAGMIKAILSILVVFKFTTKDAQVYQILNFMADSAFYFLPIMLANSAAKKFKCNPYLAMMLGGILLHPNFVGMVAASKETGEAIKFLFLPIYNANYASSVIPIILIVWLQSYVEPLADRISPKAIKFFSKPLITILITGFAALVVVAPIGYVISSWVGVVMNTMNERVSWLAPTILGFLSPLLVMTGTHYGLLPIAINNRLTIGYDTLMYPGMLASNTAQGASALAVSLKTKNSELKQLASSAGITAVCGITEPALYGVNLRFRSALYGAMIGGGVGGFFMGITKVRNYSGGSPGLLTLPSFIGGDSMSSFTFACIGMAISVAVSFIVTYMLYKDSPELVADIEKKNSNVTDSNVNNNNSNETSAQKLIYSPLKGDVVDIKEVEDAAFSSGVLGKGVAIMPTEGVVYAPVNGTVTTLFKTNHAIGIVADNGVEILIHVGMDTVQLDGKHFAAKIAQGDQIKIGQPLVEFDIEAIKAEGYSVITPVVVTNTANYSEVVGVFGKTVNAQDELIKVL